MLVQRINVRVVDGCCQRERSEVVDMILLVFVWSVLTTGDSLFLGGRFLLFCLLHFSSLAYY